MMKKIYNLLMIAVVALTASTLAGCDADDNEVIAYTLEGTWKGEMYITEKWSGRVYNSTYSVIEFSKDPYRYAKGEGYWVDYYSNAPWDYVANHITWEVRNSIIYVHFYEEGADVEISDYYLEDGYFVGTMYDGHNYVDFKLYHTHSPLWDDYDYGFYDYYWSNGANFDSTDDKAFHAPMKIEKPVRRLMAK